jgi:hypothetical protein
LLVAATLLLFVYGMQWSPTPAAAMKLHKGRPKGQNSQVRLRERGNNKVCVDVSRGGGVNSNSTYIVSPLDMGCVVADREVLCLKLHKME